MFLGIDCGTQGTKTLLTDANGRALGRGYAPHQLIETASGAREQEPDWWIEALIAASRQALEAKPDLQAIGVSGQQHGLVVLDEEHRVIRPAKLWNDTETAAQNEQLIARFGGASRFFERFGIVPRTGYTVSKLLWLKQNEAENFARIRHILLPHEYLNFWLTGEFSAEFGDASGTGYFDPRDRRWIPELLDAIDGGTGHLLKALPSFRTTEEPAGKLRDEAAHALGVAPGSMVSSGGGDNMMGAIGTGNVREGVVTISLGTSSTVYSHRERNGSDPTGCVAPFCSSTGAWLPLVCTMNATNVVTQTLTLLGKTVNDIDAALSGSEPGAQGITFLPFLNGERTPDLPLAQGTILGLTANNWSASNLIRATIEGVSFGVLEGLRLMMEDDRPERIVLIGGGAKSAGWRQLIADATGSTVVAPVESEAGCLGACIQAIYMYERQQCGDASLSSIVDRCVVLDLDMSLTPRESLYAGYQEARAVYLKRLGDLHPGAGLAR